MFDELQSYNNVIWCVRSQLNLQNHIHHILVIVNLNLNHHLVACDEISTPPRNYLFTGLVVIQHLGKRFCKMRVDDNGSSCYFPILCRYLPWIISLSLYKIMARYCHSNYLFNCYRGRRVKFDVWGFWNKFNLGHLTKK